MGHPGGVAARAAEAIKQSEPYYYDALRKHLDIVCKVLHAADRWPPSVPFLIDACDPATTRRSLAMAEQLAASTRDWRGARASTAAGSSAQGTKDLGGGTLRLEVALALASRQMVTPRHDPRRARPSRSVWSRRCGSGRW